MKIQLLAPYTGKQVRLTILRRHDWKPWTDEGELHLLSELPQHAALTKRHNGQTTLRFHALNTIKAVEAIQ